MPAPTSSQIEPIASAALQGAGLRGEDLERVRAQYTLALDYSLRTLASYLANHPDDRTLWVILGDHQPAPLITGRDAGRDVRLRILGEGELRPRLEAQGRAAGVGELLQRPPPASLEPPPSPAPGGIRLIRRIPRGSVMPTRARNARAARMARLSSAGPVSGRASRGGA